MKRIIAFFMSLVLSLSTLGMIAIADSGDSLSMYGIRVADSENTTIEKDELELLLEYAKPLANTAEFRNLLSSNSQRVTLTPEQLLKIALYSGTDEAMEQTRQSWQGKKVSIDYDQGFIIITGINEKLLRGDYNGIHTHTNRGQLINMPAKVACFIDVTGTFDSGSLGGSKYYTKYISSSYTTTKQFGYYMATIDGVSTNHSTGTVYGQSWCSLKFRGSGTSSTIKVTCG